MNLKHKKFERAYFLFAVFASSILLSACTQKTVQLAANIKTTTKFESEPNEQSHQRLTSHLENEDLNSLEPQIVRDANGNEMAVWEEYDGTRFGIWAKRRVAPTKQDGSIIGVLERSTPIDGFNTANAYHPQVQFDAKGNAIAVWEQSNGVVSSVWTNSYNAGKGWGTSQQIKTLGEGSAKKPQIAITSNNLPIVVWQQSSARNPEYFRIFATQQIADFSWSAPILIDADQGNSSSPSIANDVNGNAIAIWHTFDGVRNKIKANYFTALGGWTKASSVETSYSDAYSPRITLDVNGNAIAVWHQMDKSRPNFWANRFMPQAGWGQAKLVKPDLSDGDFPTVGIDHFGNAVLASY
jgi:hypothetical protein